MVLKELTAIRGVSGDEGRIRAYIREKCEAVADRVTVDKMGNVIAFKKGKKPGANATLLCAHMDEVGMIVIGIEDTGLLAYRPVGGIDPRVVVSKRVKVGAKEIPGVIGAKAIHLQTEEELKHVLTHEEMYIDIGAKDKASAESAVQIGDFVSFDSDWVDFGAGLVKVKALDDRVGCMTMLSILENDYPGDVTCAFTVQEELGMHGARAAARSVHADCAIVLEGTTSNDMGCVPEDLRVCSVGKGVAISFMDRASIANPALNRALRALATKKKIAWQVKTFIAGGNDAGAVQTAAGALATCVLSVPCRYIHSPSSVASLNDVEAQYLLTDAFLAGGAKF